MAYWFNQTWFNQWFGQTWFQSNITQNQFQNNIQPQMYNNTNNTNNVNNTRFPWLDNEQIKRMEELADKYGLTWKERENYLQNLYRDVITSVQNENKLKQRDQELDVMCYNTANEKDTNKRSNNEKINRVWQLAQQIKKIYPDLRSADEDDNDTINWFVTGLMSNWYPEASKDYCNYINNWDKTFWYKYKLETPKFKEQTGVSWLWLAGIWAWALGITATALAWPAEKIWNIMYQNSMPKTMQDSRAEIDEMAGGVQKEADIKRQNKVVKEAETALKKAQKEWKWIEEAQTALDEAKAWLEEIKSRWIKEADTTMDTWLEFNIRGWIKKMAAKAKVAKDDLWKDEIKNVIDNSPQRINVLDITNKFVNDNAYKWYNGKIQKETAAALKNIQKYYGRNSDLWSISLSDLQDLKSSIMDDLADAYQAIANWDRAKLTTEEKLLEKYANTLKNALQEAMQKETDTNVKNAFKKRADLDRIYWEWIKTNAKKDAGKITDNIMTRATQQLRSRGGWTLSKVGWWIKNLRNKAWKTIKEGAETILKDIEKNAGKETKNIIKNWLKKWAKWLLDPVAIVMPDSRDIIDSQELWISTLKRIASWNPNYTDRKMEELLNKEWATYDTAIAEMLDHLKNNDEFNKTARWLGKNRVTTYREAVEELWKEDPDELIELFENYLAQKWSGWR